MGLKDRICSDLRIGNNILSLFISARISYLPAYTFPDISTTSDQLKAFLPELARQIGASEGIYLDNVLMFVIIILVILLLTLCVSVFSISHTYL